MLNQIPWGTAAGVFLGTLPLLGAVLWNLMEVKGIRAELLQMRGEIAQIGSHIANIRERLATLEERDRWTHGPLVKN